MAVTTQRAPAVIWHDQAVHRRKDSQDRPRGSRSERGGRRRHGKPDASADEVTIFHPLPGFGHRRDDTAAIPLPMVSGPWSPVTAAGLAAAIGLVLLGATALSLTLLALVIAALQAGLIVAWILTFVPPAARAATVAGVVAAAVADTLTMWVTPHSLTGVAIGGASGFFVAVAAQLLLGGKRTQVTMAIAHALWLVALLLSVTSLLVVRRHPYGAYFVCSALCAIVAALVTANLVDARFTKPAMHPMVPRGLAGAVLGVAAAALVYPIVFFVIKGSHHAGGITTLLGAVAAGIVLGLVALLTDIGVAYERAGRMVASESELPTGYWRWAALASGPTAAFALSASVTYAAAVLIGA